MDSGSIWWGQIGSSLKLLTEVTNRLRDGTSSILHCPQGIPWPDALYEAVEVRRTAFSAQRRLVRLPWPEGADPGEFILFNLCSPEVASEYWPGQSCGEYLGAREDTGLEDYHIWVTGIRKDRDIARWHTFLQQYAASGKMSKAVFLLEYSGKELPPVCDNTIPYKIKPHDCRVFCLESAAVRNNTDVPDYQAELALCIGRNNPELSDALLSLGEALPAQPVSAAESVLRNSTDSAGNAFPAITSLQLKAAVGKADIQLFFPMLEQYRLQVIENIGGKLAGFLPIENAFGEVLSEPMDLEFGNIKYILANHPMVSKEEYDTICFCSKARNYLAHNKRLNLTDVRRILAL